MRPSALTPAFVAPFAPTLETPRLRLRGCRVDDFPASAALWADQAATRHVGGPRTTEESWGRLLRHAGHWALLGCGVWVVEERLAEGPAAFVGEIGFLDLKRDIDPPLSDAATRRIEVGWVVSPAHQGKGYATEAVQRALAWARQHFPAAPVVGEFVCTIDPANTASLRVAAHCGFVQSHTAVARGKTLLVLTAPRSIE